MDSSVDITAAINDAAMAAESETDPGCPYGELMETYVELGLLLESGRDDASYVEDCAGLVDQLIALGVEMDRWSEQRWFAWVAKNTTFGGEVEGGQ